MKKKLFVLAVLMIFVLIGTAMAQQKMSAKTPPSPSKGKGCMGGCRQGMRGGMHERGNCLTNPHMIKMLGLTEEQEDKLRKIASAQKKREIDSRAEMAKLRVDLADLMHQFDKDIPEIKKNLEKSADISIQMQIDRLKSMEESKAVLTAEQIKKLKMIMRNPMKMKKMNPSMKNMKPNPSAPPPEDMPDEGCTGDCK